MTQQERDRLLALKKAKRRLITEKQTAEEIGVTERQVRRLLQKLRRKGDGAVIHALRGKASTRRLPAELQRQAISILSDPVYRKGAPVRSWANKRDRPAGTHPPTLLHKAHISTLLGIGHFYFALTGG